MGEDAALFARMVVIGVVIAAPVGAMAMLLVQRTLAHGWRAGAATGAGIATADGTYAALAAFGVTAVSQWLVRWSGIGQSGSFAIELRSQTHIQIGEAQVVTVSGGG